MRSFVTLTIGLLALVLTINAASANDPNTERDKLKASEYFDRGMILFDAQEYSKAAEAFLKAYETYSHPSTLINIAMCYEKAGWAPKAYTYYRKYLTEVQDSPDVSDIKNRLRGLMLSVGEIIVSCSFEPCTIKVDGTNYGNAPTTVVVDPGIHSVESYYGNKVVAQKKVRIEAGAFEEINFVADTPLTVTIIEQPLDTQQPEPKPETNPTPEPQVQLSQQPAQMDTTTAGKLRLRPPFWVLATGTILSGAATAIIGGKLVGVHNDFEKDKSNTDLQSQGQSLQIGTNVMYGVTGAFALATVIAFTIDVVHSVKTPVNVATGPGAGLTLGYSF